MVTIEHLKRMPHANGGRLLLRTPDPFPFGTCICSNVDTIFSWTCYFSRLCISNIARYFYFAYFSFDLILITTNICMISFLWPLVLDSCSSFVSLYRYVYLFILKYVFFKRKGRNLTQSCDKSPYTLTKVQKATWEHKKTLPKTSITQRLRTHLGRSIE